MTEEHQLDISQVPMLSRHASELLALSDEARDSIRRLALLAVQDPVAVARILTLANSAAQASQRLVTDVELGLTRIGSMTAYDILLKSALLNALVSREHPRLLDYLTSDIFSMGLTAKRISHELNPSMRVDQGRLTLLGAVYKLGLAWMVRMSDRAVEGIRALERAANQRLHILNAVAELQPWIRRSAVVAQAWGLPQALHDELAVLTNRATPTERLSNEAACLLLAEQYLELMEAGLPNADAAVALERRLQLDVTPAKRLTMVWLS